MIYTDEELIEMRDKLNKALNEVKDLEIRTTGINLRRRAQIIEAIVWVESEMGSALVRSQRKNNVGNYKKTK